MILRLSRLQKAQLLDWAAQAGERECCGLLLGNDGFVEAIDLAENVATDPTAHFEINPAELIAAERAARAGGASVLGYFHSHPNGRAQPSIEDSDMAADDGRFWVIIANGEASAWCKRAGQTAFEAATLVIDG